MLKRKSYPVKYTPEKVKTKEGSHLSLNDKGEIIEVKNNKETVNHGAGEIIVSKHGDVVIGKQNGTVKPIGTLDAPGGLVTSIYYKVIIAIMALLFISTSYVNVWIVKNHKEERKEFIARLKTRDIVFIGDDSARLFKVGGSPFKRVKLFTIHALQKMFTYGAFNYEDAIRAAQEFCTPAVAVRHEKMVRSEIYALKNRKGFYQVRFSKGEIDPRQGDETGEYIVEIEFERGYTNDTTDEPKPQKVHIILLVRDENEYARADILESAGQSDQNIFQKRIHAMRFPELER